MSSKKLSDLTYADDKLGRNEEFGNGVLSLIQNSEKVTDSGSLVLALDSGWGTGKTWFLHMFMNDLKSKKLKTIYYNAWENDDWGNALIPVVARIKDILSESPDQNSEHIIEQIEDKTNEIGVFLKNNWRKITFNITSGFLKKITSVDIQQIKEMYDEVTTDLNLTKEYDDFISAKNDFKKELAELSESQKVIFLIDELDRCRPTFAIETLEVIKHFFDVKNFVFVFALDMQQLSCSIKTTYGQDMDTPGYLRRFFDMQLCIPSASLRKYLDTIIGENFISIKYKYDFKLDEIKDEIFSILNFFQLSLRDTDIVLKTYLIFHSFYRIHISSNYRFVINVYLYLIILKYKETSLYNQLFSQTGTLITNSHPKYRFYHNRLPYINDFLSTFNNDNMKTKISDFINSNEKYEYQFNRIRIRTPLKDEIISHYIFRHLEILGFNDESSDVIELPVPPLE